MAEKNVEVIDKESKQYIVVMVSVEGDDLLFTLQLETPHEG